MANVTGQTEQGVGPQVQQAAHIPLRAGEQVLLITRWDGGWANSIGVFLFLCIVSSLGLLSGGDFWTLLGVVFGFATIVKLGLEILSRASGRAVLTDQRIVVRGLPSPFINNEIELKDVQELKAPTDLMRVGGGMSRMTVITRAGKTRGVVVPHAARIVEVYSARVKV